MALHFDELALLQGKGLLMKLRLPNHRRHIARAAVASSDRVGFIVTP